MGVLIGLWLNVNFLSLGHCRSTALAVSPLPHALVQRQDHRRGAGALLSHLRGDLIWTWRGHHGVHSEDECRGLIIRLGLGTGTVVRNMDRQEKRRRQVRHVPSN